MSTFLNRLLLPTVALLLASTLGCQSPHKAIEATPHATGRGHAHNDYEHPRPLLDALAAGFSSVEADVHLVDGALLVAHDADEVRSERTLQRLYLDPLREAFRTQQGEIVPGVESFILLIDFKTAAESTYRALETVLEDYRPMLTSYQEATTLPGAVTIILSGNRPTQIVGQQASRLVAIDGRLPDLSRESIPVELIPLISDNWKSHFKWRGSGPLPVLEKQKLESLVHRAHDQGRIIRFWGNPDIPAYWSLAQRAGVDLINTDNLEGLSRFLAPQDASATP